jgi:diguanylate cyclase (GGDEF)-like protein/PAS domain S-box-containing protein
MRRHPDRVAPSGTTWKGIPASAVAIVALVAVPTVVVAAGLGLLAAPRFGTAWAVAAGVGYVLLAAAIAPLVLRLDEGRVRRPSRRFVQGFEDAAIGMAILTRDLTLVRVNDTFCELLGRPMADLVGHRILEFTHPDDLVPSVAKQESIIKGDEAPIRKRYLRPDGSVVDVMLISAFVDPGDAEPYFFSQLQDVTEQYRAERQKAAIAELGRRALEVDSRALMNEATRLIRDILEAHSCLAFRRLADGEMRLAASSSDNGSSPLTVPVDASQAGYTVLRNESVVSNDLVAETRFAVPAIVFERGLQRALSVPVPERAGVRHVLLVHAPASGRAFGVEDVRFVEAVANVLGGALDHAATEDELRRRALEDPLTGLGNRALLMSHLERELRHGARLGNRLSLLLIDLDRFKVVNDTLGHSAGDTLLRQVATRLSACVRDEDIVARPGGDEFVVVSTRTDSDQAIARIAQRLLDAFAEPFDVEGRELSCSASMGIAVAVSGDESVGELLRDADVAMYRAKEIGGGRFEVFDAALRERLIERLTAEEDLRHALELDQFELRYQPLVALEGEDVVGFEALLRWRHPERGLVQPLDFIEIAEETGLIRPIGSWVLQTACAELAGLPEPIYLSVNLSALQVSHDLVDEVEALLKRYELRADRLVLEITERLVLEPRTKPVVARLRALGVHVALDDFGTGYSSLGSLQRFPIDVVKLDRVLLRALADESGPAVLTAVVELGRALGLRVIAEGIESRDQLDRLRHIGCVLGQGFLFAKPLPLADARLLVDAPRAADRDAA